MDQLVKRKKYRRNTLGFWSSKHKRVAKVRVEILQVSNQKSRLAAGPTEDSLSCGTRTITKKGALLNTYLRLQLHAAISSVPQHLRHG